MADKPVVNVNTGFGDLGFFLFLIACVVTCGWSPHCGCQRIPVPSGPGLSETP
jgi:hypothetical protein